jgi:cysteine-rich repeat protein
MRATRRRPYCILIPALLALLVVPAAAAPQPCTGDCNGNGEVTVDELITGVNIALGSAAVDSCPAFADGAGVVDISQLIRAVNNALGICSVADTATPTETPTHTPTATEPPPTDSPSPTATATASATLPPPSATQTATAPSADTPTATATPTTTATVTATRPTRTPTATLGPAVCGDNIVNIPGGETCDDGNTLDGDACPATCRAHPCTAGSIGTMVVELRLRPTPADAALAAATVFLRYREDRITIPGSNADAAVRERVTSPAGFSVTPNDFDYGLRAVLIDPSLVGISGGLALAVEFDLCGGEAVPLARDFRCDLLDAAALDDTGNPIDVSGQVTCQVTVKPPALPLVCGDSIVNLAGGETCDDGNTDDGDACPADCHVESCALPGAEPVTANIAFVGDVAIAGATVLVGYPDGSVGIAGSSQDASVLERVTSTVYSVTPNDLDYAVRAVLIDPTFLGVPAGTTALTVGFDRCAGGPAPSPGAFTCAVLDASDAELNDVTDEVSCEVSLF